MVASCLLIAWPGLLPGSIVKPNGFNSTEQMVSANHAFRSHWPLKFKQLTTIFHNFVNFTQLSEFNVTSPEKKQKVIDLKSGVVEIQLVLPCLIFFFLFFSSLVRLCVYLLPSQLITFISLRLGGWSWKELCYT